jgi:hypothetical protein
MRGVLPILCCTFLLIGGGMLMAPAGTTDVPVFYEVQTATLPASVAVQTTDVQSASTGIAVPGDQLASLSRQGAGGGCSSGQCPIRQYVRSKTETTVKVEVAAEKDDPRQPVRRVAARSGGIVRGAIGLLLRR